MMAGSHKFSVIGVGLSTLLILCQLLFQFQLINLVFIILLILMVSVAFFREKNRLLVWMIISFSGGLFVFMYLDRISLELTFAHPTRLVLSRFLFLIPILSVYYVIRKFKNKPISFPFKVARTGWNNGFLLLTGLQVTALLFYVSKAAPLPFDFLFMAILYSSINTFVIEYLWRGLFLYHLKMVIGQLFAIIFTSLSAAIGYYLFGYSIGFCCIFFLIGLLLGRFTIQSNSLAPAMLYHFLLSFTYILKNMVPLFS